MFHERNDIFHVELLRSHLKCHITSVSCSNLTTDSCSAPRAVVIVPRRSRNSLSGADVNRWNSFARSYICMFGIEKILSGVSSAQASDVSETLLTWSSELILSSSKLVPCDFRPLCFKWLFHQRLSQQFIIFPFQLHDQVIAIYCTSLLNNTDSHFGYFPSYCFGQNMFLKPPLLPSPGKIVTYSAGLFRWTNVHP